MPVPLHSRSEVAMPAAHVGAPHAVAEEYSRQAPLPLQKPSVPHDAAPRSAHWLFGSVPVATLPHTPFCPCPFAAALHAEQIPVQAVLQQTPSAQKPVAHSSPLVHGEACASVAVHVAPFIARSQKCPDAQSVSRVHAAHVPALQSPLTQSVATSQSFPFPHGGHEPPQPMSVSLPSRMPSLQLGATQTFITHARPEQSVAVLQPTHAPSPLQTAPMWSVQAVPATAFVFVHAALVPHDTAMQTVADAAQSVTGFVHAPLSFPASTPVSPPASEPAPDPVLDCDALVVLVVLPSVEPLPESGR
jgi:hypothetical protein